MNLLKQKINLLKQEQEQELEQKNINTILFDFGGTLDSDGIHSRHLFFNIFQKQFNFSMNYWKIFQDAYSFADQTINNEGLVVKLDLKGMNYIFVLLIVSNLNRRGDTQFANKATKRDIDTITTNITKIQSYYLRRNKKIIKHLNNCSQFKNRLGIISNFSGNLEIILEQFNLRSLFKVVIDSHYTGLQKPDQKIFKLGLKSFSPIADAEEAIYIGDNIERDILPAKKIKMHTILISNKNKNEFSNKDLKILNQNKKTLVLNHLYKINNLLYSSATP
ncbi:MAG: HAD family hydrolase [Oligoflexia bacterium]|nr:HAD family hydrolase [Oligoflexia bacterium]